MITRRPMRYAHSSGHTDVCYSSDGKYIITCGSDGDVRIWLGLEDDDPSSVCAGEKAFSVKYAQKSTNNADTDKENNSHIFVATDSLYVQALTFPEGDRDGIIARFTAPVSHLAIDKKAKILVAASQDMTVQIVSLVDNKVITTLTELKGPALSVAICPNRQYIAVSAGDGILRIWSLETKTVVKELNCVSKVNSFSDALALCRPSFEPINGKYLIYPHESNIHIIDTMKWESFLILTDPEAEGEFSICEYSPCGNYIAAATTKGCISVWQGVSKKLLGCFPHPNKYTISALMWNPKGNGEFAFCDTMGQFGTVIGCSKVVQVNDMIVNEENCGVLNEFNYEDDDDDGDNVISLEKIKNDALGINIEDTKDDESRPQSRNSIQVPGPIVAQFQPPFQSGSTPSHLLERYMAWNEVGIIRAYETESDKHSIEVEFHDTSIHHAMHLTNYLNHTIASLSTTALAMACDTPSKLVCIPLSTGGSREWQIDLPEGEEAMCLTVSENFLALATDARFLRLFTIYGTQREVICIPGPVVALASRKSSLLVAYHSGIGSGSDQVISLLIIHIQGQNVTSTQIHIPLSPGASLMWLGHTDTGSPATFDSAGILRVFTPRTSVWLPLYDHTKHQKNSMDGFFVVDVSETTQVIRGVSCKGSKYPPITPRPTLSEMELRLPTCDQGTEKNDFEEKLARWNHCQVIQPDKAKKEVAIKLFALACRSDLEQRAIELVEMMENSQILELAVKYASRLGKMHLSDKLVQLAELWDESGILTNFTSNNIIDEVNENRAVAFDASRRQFVKKSRNEYDTEAPKPLELKKNSYKKVILAEPKQSSSVVQSGSTVEETENFEESHCSKDNTEDSLLLTPTPVKDSRNPFSKKTIQSKSNDTNPFNFTETLSKEISETNKENTKGQEVKNLMPVKKSPANGSIKRKQLESAINEKPNKQSKLSAFAFSKRTE